MQILFIFSIWNNVLVNQQMVYANSFIFLYLKQCIGESADVYFKCPLNLTFHNYQMHMTCSFPHYTCDTGWTAIQLFFIRSLIQMTFGLFQMTFDYYMYKWKPVYGSRT